MFRIERPGIYYDVQSEDYFSDCCPEPSLSQSISKVLIEQSPLHAKCAHPRLGPPALDDDDDEKVEKYVAALAIGNACHRILIGRGKEIASAPWADWRSKEARAFRSEQTKAGKTPVLSKHIDEARNMILALRLQLTSAGLGEAFKEGNGSGEVCIVAQDGETWLRSLVDWMQSTTMLYDLKSSATSYAPHNIALKIEKDGWHVQAAFQERILDLIDPDNAGRRKFRFIALENFPPYAIVPVELDEHWMTIGRKKVHYAFELWRRCMSTDHWPAYPLELLRPEYPQFREAAWLKREIEHADRRETANLLAAG